MIRKLLLPAAGRAVRMGGVLKELLPLGLRRGPAGLGPLPAPVLAWSLRAAARVGVESGIVVTSSLKAPALMEVIASLDLPISISYLHQPQPRGLGSAVALAAPEIRSDELVLLLLPDAVLWPAESIAETVRAVEEGAVASATLVRVDQPERFGVAHCAADGRVVGFTDKPAQPASSWIWAAVAFRKEFFRYLERTLGPDGEGELTPALDLAVREGALAVRRAEGGAYWDVGTYDGYMAALNALASLGPAESLLDLASGRRPENSPYVPLTGPRGDETIQ